MAMLLAGCGGGGSGSANSALPGTGGGTNTQSSQTQQENAINGVNSMGSSMKNISSAESNISLSSDARAPQSLQALGTCNNNMEFFSPDKNGDPNSTETQFFYDSACTQLARDVVRVISNQTASSETVARTVNLYAQGSSTASATRTDTVNFENATFDKYFFPIAKNGFARQETNVLTIAGAKTINSDNEFVMQPGSSPQSYCMDSAGYNATGIASLNETFGWQGGALSGATRTVNSDGSVTWASTHSGNSYKGAIGALSVNTGTANTSCPITTPMFTLSGGTQVGSYNLPISATYNFGMLVNLTITNATLANGNTLNVTTNTSVPPTSSTFINGAITNSSGPVASFAVDTFGDGTLTVASSGTVYTVTDWHVIK